MLDYLNDLLGKEDSLSIAIWDEDSSKWIPTKLVVADKIGIVTWSKPQTTFTPWGSVTSIRVLNDQ